MTNTNNNYTPESCDAILGTAKHIYLEESERFKQAEAKTNITLAFVGVLFGIYLTFLGAFEPITQEPGYLIYTFLIKAVIFLSLVISISFFIKSVKTGVYDQVSLNDIVNYNFAKEDECKVKLEIAATYKDAIDFNKSGVETKMKFYSKGLIFMYWGFITFATHYIIEEVIKYV